MNTAKRICGGLLVLSAVCLLYTGCLIVNAKASIGVLFPASLLFAAAVYTVNMLFLRKDRSLTMLFALNGAAALAFLLPCFLVGLMDGALNILLLAAMGILPACLAPYLNLTPPKLSQCILLLEGALVLLLLQGLILSERTVGAVVYLPAGLGVITAMACLLLYRMEGLVSLRSAGVLCGLFLLLFLLCALLLMGAGAAGGGIVSIVSGIGSGAAGLWGLIQRAAQAIASLFHPEELDEGMAIDLSQGVVTEAADTVSETGNHTRAGVLILVLVLVIVIAALIFILRRFGKIRMGGSGAQQKKPEASRVSPLEALRRSIAALQRKRDVRLWLRRNRNTPAGVFYLMERRCRRSALALRPADTPGDFLRRLSLAAEPEASAAILALTGPVNRAIFAGVNDATSIENAGVLLKAAGAAARKHRLPKKEKTPASD